MAVFRSSKGGNLRIGLPPKTFGWRESEHPERAADGSVIMTTVDGKSVPLKKKEAWPNIVSKTGEYETNDPVLIALLRRHSGNTANTGAAGMFFEEAEATTQAVALAQGRIVFKVPSGGVGMDLHESLVKLYGYVEGPLPPNPAAMENIRMLFAEVLTEFQAIGVQAPPRNAEGGISTRTLLKSSIVTFFQALADGNIWKPEPKQEAGAA